MPVDSKIIQALYDALKPDPFYATLQNTCDHDGRGRDAMLAYYEASIEDGLSWGRVGLPADGHSGASVWSIPLGACDAEKRRMEKQRRLSRALGPKGLAVFNKIEASMAQHEAKMDLEGFWYLSILGVAPETQGKGIGVQLVEQTLKEADDSSVASYLTTFTPRNIPFYERLGYACAGTFLEPVTDSSFSILIRTPR